REDPPVSWSPISPKGSTAPSDAKLLPRALPDRGVDDHLELRRRLNGKVRRICSLQYPIDIGSRLPVLIDQVVSVGNQTTRFHKMPERVNRSHPIACRERCRKSEIESRSKERLSGNKQTCGRPIAEARVSGSKSLLPV